MATMFAAVLLAVALVPGQWVKTADWKAFFFDAGIVAATSDGNRLYAFNASPSLLVSDDGGTTWRSVSTAAVGSAVRIAVDPLDANVIYAVTSGGWNPGLYKSTNAGAAFTRIGDYVGVAVDPHNPSVLYASRNPPGGMFKSIDGGDSWFPTGRVGSVHRFITVDPNDSSVVYATGFDCGQFSGAGGFYRTFDGGITWPSVYPGYTTTDFMTVDAASRIYTIAETWLDTPLLRGTNLGSTWRVMAIDVLTEPSLDGGERAIAAIASDPQRKETIYAAILNLGVVVSYDDGLHWQRLGELADRQVIALTVMPDGVVIAATRNGIYRYTPPPPPRRRAVR